MEERLQQTLDWLYSLEARGIVYKLERMERALKLIGDPHLKLGAVHIAGTKGKGSVAAMLDSVIRASGYRTGLYTKPHLVNLSERTRVDGAEIPARLMLKYIETLRSFFDRAGMALTFFEFTVALMFLYFAEAKVDVAIIETGLGGRLDSTNVVRPRLSVITPIGFDHMEYLGYTIASIAAEKGGIIKPGVPTVIGTRGAEARNTLSEIAASQKSPVLMIDREFSYVSRSPSHRLDYHGMALNLEGLELNLAGAFQHENAAIAIAAVEALRAQGLKIGESEVRRGLEEVYWPGRFDVVCHNPRVILDCAHNELSVQALVETVAAQFGENMRPHLVFGCQEDKQWRRMADLLVPRIGDVVLTRAKPKHPLDPEIIASEFSRRIPTVIVREPLEAIKYALARACSDETVLVAGSVYLIGEVYSYFLGAQGRRSLFPEASA